MSGPVEVFLSHSSDDADTAIEIARVLGECGISTWYAPREIVGSQKWQDEIGAALGRCDWFMLLLSPGAVRSMWVRRELQYALIQRRYDGRITPVLISPCDPDNLSWVLQTFQQVDLTRRTGEAYANLLRVWGKEFGPVA